MKQYFTESNDEYSLSENPVEVANKFSSKFSNNNFCIGLAKVKEKVITRIELNNVHSISDYQTCISEIESDNRDITSTLFNIEDDDSLIVRHASLGESTGRSLLNSAVTSQSASIKH